MLRAVTKPGCAALLWAALLSHPVLANQNRTAQDLSEVQQELKKNQQALSEQQQALDAMQASLRQDELKVAESARNLNRLQQDIAANEQQQTELKKDIRVLEKKKDELNTLLAAQLKSAYMAGGHDYTKLLLNQQNTAKLERTLSYYNYLNKARIDQLDALKLVLEKLEQNRATLAEARSALEHLKQRQTDNREQLLAAKAKRQQSLQDLKNKLTQIQDSILYLQQNEKTLVKTLEELAELEQEEVTLAGLEGSEGTLPWPAEGRLTQSFGKPKHGHLTWKGVVLSGNEGDPVHSVHNGQVVFADWLRGFGWVIVVDHGEGYMSLYGHAQTLLREVGDMVRQGETIALVGQSGGQSDPGLYFEIRHKGRAINPTKWCSRS